MGHVGGVILASHLMILVIENMKEIMMIMKVEEVVGEGEVEDMLSLNIEKEDTMIIHRNIHMKIINLNRLVKVEEEVEEGEVEDMLSLNIEKIMIQEVEVVVEETVGIL